VLALARKRLSDWHWLAFFAAVLAAWGLLYAMQPPAGLAAGAALHQPGSLPPGVAGYPVVFAMWALMTAAMMAPTFVPALATYDDLAGSGAASRGGFFQLVAGYVLIWLGFAALAAGAQIALSSATMLTPLGQSSSNWLTAGLLIGAGGYQFSALKEQCLSQCMQPFAFFMRHWQQTRWNALGMGLRLGALCLGCCWALMLLAFVGGTMNLLWMGLATLFMVLEKLPDVSRFVVRPLGVALIIAGLAVASGAWI